MMRFLGQIDTMRLCGKSTGLGVSIQSTPAAGLRVASLSGGPPEIVSSVRTFASAREQEKRPISML
jgi:hypothetical protein